MGEPLVSEWTDRYWQTIDGLRLHARDYAGPDDRPPIVCLPGLTRNARDFEPLAERLAGEWRIIAVDFRGRGLSDRDLLARRYQPATYAADVLGMMNRLAVPDAVFVGTSLGGIVTMLIAATQRPRVAGALLNDVGPEIAPEGLERIRSYVGKSGSFENWDQAAAAVAAVNAQSFPHYGEAQWQAMARRLCREGKDGILFDYDPAIAEAFRGPSAAPADGGWALLKMLQGRPVTILRGEHSDILAPDVAQRMAEALPNAELVTVPGVGHAPMLDEPESVGAVDRLLARVLRR